jgi:hypothetical protein
MLEPLDCANSTYSLIGANTANATLVKAGATFLHSIDFTNINAAVRYLKLYNKATAPAETDTPKLRIALPGGATGGNRSIAFPKPVKFTLGLGFRLVTGIADNDNTAVAANEQIVNLSYD